MSKAPRHGAPRAQNRSPRKAARRVTLERRQARAFRYGLSGRPGARS